MTSDTQSRKWQLTINNPKAHNLTQDVLESELSKLSLIYWCMSDETGEEGTYHTHVYLQAAHGIRFSTLLNHFKGAHFEVARGTGQQNRDYVFKEGKWANSEKGTTNHRDTHKEWGDLPVERQGKRNDLDDLYDMISAGFSDFDIIQSNPSYLLNIEKIEKVRQCIRENEYRNTWRDLNVTYIFGTTGSGKTREVMESYGYDKVYRVTDYTHPFDSYHGEETIMFEEFRSSLRISDMLKYLDGYPVMLPARYGNRVACFKNVYICTNIDLREQYRNEQYDQTETWYAFLRRIHTVKVYSGDYIYEMPTDLYLSDCFPFIECNPFSKGGD